MGLKERYTTKTKKVIDSVGEKDKTEISDDTFCICEFLEVLVNRGLK